MTNLTIDIMAATPIGAVAPVAAGTGVDFDALLTGIAPPVPEITAPVVAAVPVKIAAPLPIGRQGFAGATDPVAPDPVDLPAADAPNFWIALETAQPAIVRPPVVGLAETTTTPAARIQTGAAPDIAARVIEKPALTDMAVVLTPSRPLVDFTEPVAPARQAPTVVVKPAPASILPPTLRCAPIENGKPAHKPAPVLFETTAMSPPLVVSAALAPHTAVSEPTQAPAPAPVTAVLLSPDDKIPAMSMSEPRLASAAVLPAATAQRAIEEQVANAKVVVPGIPHPSPPLKHALPIYVRAISVDPSLPTDQDPERALAVVSEPPSPDSAAPPIQLDPMPVLGVPLTIAPQVATDPIAASSPSSREAAPIVAASSIMPEAIGSAPIVVPAVQPDIAPDVAVAPRSSAPAVAMPVIEPARDPALRTVNPRPPVAPLSAPAQADLAASTLATGAPRPDAPLVVDLRPALQPVAASSSVAVAQPARTAVQSSVPPAIHEALGIVAATPRPPVATPAPPIAPIAVAPVVLAPAPVAMVREVPAPAPADDSSDAIDADIAPAAPAQTIASITPRATITAPGPVTVDTTRIDWIEALVDRIDENRGASGHRNAHIRLLPDALGAVDVRIQHDGDRVNVAVTADNPQARALLAEAAPRLVELAESRGLKLGDAGVDQGRQGQRSAEQQRPAAPPRAPATAETDPATDDASDRLA